MELWNGGIMEWKCGRRYPLLVMRSYFRGRFEFPRYSFVRFGTFFPEYMFGFPLPDCSFWSFPPGTVSRYLFVIPPYASTRRSRRKGQLRRISSRCSRLTSPIRISSLSVEASAMMTPCGSARNDEPQNYHRR